MGVTPWRPTIAVLSPNTATLALRRKRSTRSPTSSRTTRSHLRLGQAGCRRRARTRRSPAALFVPRHGSDDWNGQVAKPVRVQSRELRVTAHSSYRRTGRAVNFFLHDENPRMESAGKGHLRQQENCILRGEKGKFCGRIELYDATVAFYRIKSSENSIQSQD